VSGEEKPTKIEEALNKATSRVWELNDKVFTKIPGEANEIYRQTDQAVRMKPNFTIPGHDAFISPAEMTLRGETMFENYLKKIAPDKVEGYLSARKAIAYDLTKELKAALDEGEKGERGKTAEEIFRHPATVSHASALGLSLTELSNSPDGPRVLTPKNLHKNLVNAIFHRQGTSFALLVATIKKAERNDALFDYSLGRDDTAGPKGSHQWLLRYKAVRNRAIEAMLNPENGDPTAGDLPDGTGTNALEYAERAQTIAKFAHNNELVAKLATLDWQLKKRASETEEAKKTMEKAVPAKPKDDDARSGQQNQPDDANAPPEYRAALALYKEQAVAMLVPDPRSTSRHPTPDMRSTANGRYN
jgi:hypothetical protein